MAGVVLAAGEGRRFGGPKALARIDGICFVERVAAMLTSGGCDRVVVVLGAAADEVIATADLRTVEVVVAPDWRDGMAASLRAGIGAADAVQAAAAVIALVDQPWVGPESVARLRQAWRNGATAAVATYGGDPRHPVLFDGSVWADVAASVTGDTGARTWLRDNPGLVTAVDCDGTGDPADVDTPADLLLRPVDRPLGGAERAGI